jgi:hypothetical protein
MVKAPEICPYCKKHVTNGVGPYDLPKVTMMLGALPSSHMFKMAADWHDFHYHIGRTELDREIADKLFYKDMLAAIKEHCHWYSRAWYRVHAWRNYCFVRKFGSKFFGYKGCTTRG